MDTKELVARICHEVNRAYCKSIGDNSQEPWDEAPQWKRDATYEMLDSGSKATGEERWRQWADSKRAAGWTRGPVKDGEAKTHPCLVDSYEQLPPAERLKDELLNAIVDSYVRESAKEAA